jgi:hypothetical protein
MLKGYLGCIEGCIEAVCRRVSCHDYHRALSVASVESLIKVSLLGLGRDTCRWAGTLHIDNNERELSHHSETECL